MELEEMRELTREAVRDADLRPEEIPSIDLYLDQIISLTTDKLQEGSPRFQDRSLTKTMVNNYSKSGLLSPLHGKKYSKEQFLQILLVCSMKNTLSIGEIKRILQTVYKLEDYDDAFLEDAYQRFLDSKQRIRDLSVDFMEYYLQRTGLDITNEKDFLALLLSLSCISSYTKNVAQALLEAHYPDLDAEREREERERREEAKRQKEERKRSKKAPEEGASPS